MKGEMVGSMKVNDVNYKDKESKQIYTSILLESVMCVKETAHTHTHTHTHAHTHTHTRPSLIHTSAPTRQCYSSHAVFYAKKKKPSTNNNSIFLLVNKSATYLFYTLSLLHISAPTTHN